LSVSRRPLAKINSGGSIHTPNNFPKQNKKPHSIQSCSSNHS
jgi:hypothetical protein